MSQGRPRGRAAHDDPCMGFDIPTDLVQLQRDWFAAEAHWHEAAQRGAQPAIDEAYQATQRLTMELHRHPWMQASEQRYAARMALREAARQPPASSNG